MSISDGTGPFPWLVDIWQRWFGKVPVTAGDRTAYNVGPVFLDAPSAMSQTAVWACVTLICDIFSTLPINFFERKGDERLPAVDHPLYRVLRRQPNVEQTAAQFWSAFAASMLLRGVGNAEKLMSGGRVIGLDFLNPDWLQCRKVNGVVEYWYTENGVRRRIPRDRLLRVVAFTLDGYTPCSAIKFGARAFAAGAAAEVAAMSTFERGLHKTTYFKYPTQLKREQRDDARRAIEEISGAVNSGRAVILEAGMEAGEIGISPEDAQLLESRAFSVEEQCSWFRVPPFMIGRASKGQTNWGTGLEQQFIGWSVTCISPLVRKVEQGIEKDCLRPDERERFFAEWALEGLMRGDSAARSAFYASALQNGYMNRKTAATKENLPVPPGGDLYTVQSNLIPLESLGKTPAPAVSARTALLEWLNEENR